MTANNKHKSLSEMDLTTGNLFWKVPMFTLPLAFTTILQLLYSSVDLYTVSQFGGGSTSMSAVGSNSALINLIITLFVSLSLGANVCMGNAKGADNKEYANKILHTSMVLAIITGLFIGAVGYFISPMLLNLMDTPETILSKATTYLQVYFLGLPFLMIYNYGAQILRALGDSQRPLFILVISGLVNVAFDLLFVIVFQLDVLGVALATVLSEVVSALLVVLWLMFYKKGYVTLKLKKLRIDKAALKDILKVGIPSGIQGVGFCFPNVLIQSSLYTITSYTINGVAISVDEIVAGAAASAQIENYIFAFIDAFSAGCTAFASQNHGAEKKENIRKSYYYCNIWMMVFWGIGAILSLTIPYALLSIFITDSPEIVTANAMAAGRERLTLMAISYILDGIMDIFSGYCRGMKHATEAATITVSGCVGTRCLFLWFLFPLSYFHTIQWLYAVFPLSWILVNLIFIPVVRHIEKKVFAQIDESKKLKQIQP